MGASRRCHRQVLRYRLDVIHLEIMSDARSVA